VHTGRPIVLNHKQCWTLYTAVTVCAQYVHHSCQHKCTNIFISPIEWCEIMAYIDSLLLEVFDIPHSHSTRLSFQMALQVKVELCEVRGLWWPFDWSIYSSLPILIAAERQRNCVLAYAYGTVCRFHVYEVSRHKEVA
jgi:hypothetical protein